ncbi:hypothetical protein [Cognatishimia sp. F0-27]|uniref:hypothetical protein n=1 Tax=Cognatishimia sp. F0-27 TaxID=2816855 RepID=UPI001D0CBE24|nr:hypothetical protein [Cognatishimia sp. F0-27]MCC1491930.1 hypothetical protein [Cognatishimia sp. F0-27]
MALAATFGLLLFCTPGPPENVLKIVKMGCRLSAQGLLGRSAERISTREVFGDLGFLASRRASFTVFPPHRRSGVSKGRQMF